MSTNKVALVTGATSGIGAASAKALANVGYQVVVSGRRADKGAEVVDAIVSAGGEATFVQADVADVAQVNVLVAATVETYGRLDVAVNNAGIEGDVLVPLHKATAENYQQVFDINVRGVFASMQAEIPAMLANGGGLIINMASVAGKVALPGMAIYSASKHAVIGFTKGAALDYAKAGIRVNAIAPGIIETEMYGRLVLSDAARDFMSAAHPVGRPGLSEEIASAVLWLADPANGFTTGETITVDGGYTAQ